MCKDCEARRNMAREAFLKAKFGEALKHVAKGTAEATGLKQKTDVAESKRRTVKNSRS